jgi:hypothetical protein
MKRYLVFDGDHYYPCGGWSDFRMDFDTLEEARASTTKTGFGWWQIVDFNEGKIVEEG